jgi:flagellin
MSLVINTNTTSIIARQNLYAADSRLKVSVQRLSSGLRVNSAADDAAGLARADSLRVKSRMIQAAMRNINDGFSALEVADKAAEQITNLVTRMGELAAGAAQGTLDQTGRSYYNNEYNKLIEEVDRIANTTEFGGFKLLNGSNAALTILAGFKNSSNDQLSISMNSLVAAGAIDIPTSAQEMVSVETVGDPAVSGGGTIAFDGGGGSLTAGSLNQLVNLINLTSADTGVSASVAGGPGAYSLKLVSTTPGTGHDIGITINSTPFQNFTVTPAQDAVHIGGGLSLVANALTSASGALGAMNAISSALKTINDARAVYGASTNRLKAALSNLQGTFTNYQAAESRIRDADFAFETAQYSRNTIMVQAGASVLAQANSLPRNVLSLLT